MHIITEKPVTFMNKLLVVAP